MKQTKLTRITNYAGLWNAVSSGHPWLKLYHWIFLDTIRARSFKIAWWWLHWVYTRTDDLEAWQTIKATWVLIGKAKTARCTFLVSFAEKSSNVELWVVVADMIVHKILNAFHDCSVREIIDIFLNLVKVLTLSFFPDCLHDNFHWALRFDASFSDHDIILRCY